MELFIDIVIKRIYLFNIAAWNYRKKIGFPVCKKENFAGLQAHRKRGKSARASPTPHHILNEERSARFTAQHLSALAYNLVARALRTQCVNRVWVLASCNLYLQLFFEIEVNSGQIFTKPRKPRGKYSQSHYSPRLKRIIVLVYTHEVIANNSVMA